jgi:hypothetical protein
MAPEQAFGAEMVDRRSDIYSLGVMLFEMLSGQLPVRGENPQEIAEKILHQQVLHLAQARPGLPHELCRIVERAMHPNPDLRYPDVRSLSSALLPYAPAVDRASAVGAYPQDSRGYATGMAMPFTPVAVTPIASDYESAGDRGIPNTIPPVDAGPPVAAQRPNLPAVKTQSMPEAAQPTNALRAAPATVVKNRRRASGVGWAIFAILILGGGVGGWLYYDQYVAISSPPPPQPVPRPTQSSSATAQIPPDLAEPEPIPIGDPHRAPSRGTRPPSSAGRGLPEFPPIALPTELPALPPIPSELPRTLPTLAIPPNLPTLMPIPGFPAPGLNNPAPSSEPH